MPNLTSQLCGFVALSMGDGAIQRSPEHSSQNSWTSHSNTSLGNFQHWYLSDMLASVYSCQVCLAVEAVFFQIQSYNQYYEPH